MSNNLERPLNYLTQVREVGLLSGEKVVCLFAPETGIVPEPTTEGRLLVTTNRRIISFEEGQSAQDTMLIPIEDMKAVSVRNGSRNSLSWTQALLMIAGGLVIYLVVSYWLTTRFDGPSIPLINIDLAPLVVLLALLTGAWIAWQHYFASEGGSIRFQGSDWSFSLPYPGETAGEEVYQLINLMFSARNGHSSRSMTAGDL
ncbi:MAG: hypothetical protein O2909_10905 [Chloroflexi bacterium]|nr:hypothetical protein [Chloroflexota bacterium]PKB57967.1 MAG: hypothetical protein BZY73_00430 [SAR202 cluster bacterium Casp-Chloro-G3]